MYVLAYVKMFEEMNGIVVRTFRAPQELLDCLVNEMGLYQPDYDYEPDDNYEADLDTVLSELDEIIHDDDTDYSMLTITKNNEVLFTSGI